MSTVFIFLHWLTALLGKMTLLNWISILAMTCSIGGNIFINFKNKFGFYVWIFSNILWVLCNFIGPMNVFQIITFVVYAGCNVHGLWKWTKEEREKRRIRAIEKAEKKKRQEEERAFFASRAKHYDEMARKMCEN